MSSIIAPIDVDGTLFYIPETLDQLRDLVRYAYQNDKKVRVRGSAHSVAEGLPPSALPIDGIFIILNNFKTVTIDQSNLLVTAGGGCHLGLDPNDPTGVSTFANSLIGQLDAVGLAFPDTGGIIHQTVGGFLSTGSSGSRKDVGFNEAIQSLTFVTGTANADVVTINRSHPDFYAAVVSLGLFGIIIEARFKVVPRYRVIGEETTTTVEACAIDFFGDGSPTRPSLETFFRTEEYKRINWWPQPGVDKAIVWKAKQFVPDDGRPAQPYVELTRQEQKLIHILYTVIDIWPALVRFLKPISAGLATAVDKWCSKFFYFTLFPKIAAQVLKDETKPFVDIWYQVLPMDNGISDTLLPVKFTELWTDLKYTKVVMNTMKETFDHYFYNKADTPDAAGLFSTEIYTAKASEYWLSAAYKSDVIRIDVFCYAKLQTDEVVAFYKIFWDALDNIKNKPGYADFYYRPHWGKYAPSLPTSEWKKKYPKWNDFMEIRKKHDPKGIFVNKYWAQILDI